MRLSVAQVKPAILHPNQEVREAAVYYFAKSFSLDPELMPLAIQVITAHGWEAAFQTYSFLQDFVQSEETVQWLIDELGRQGKKPHGEEHGRYIDHLGSALENADLAV